MEEHSKKYFFENILKNSNITKIKNIIDDMKLKGVNDFIDRYYSEKRTPLIWAITNKNTDIVKILIENSADINKEDGSLGWKPIHYASIYEIESIIQTLIDNNAYLNGLNNKKQTAIHLAVSKNKIKSTKLLLSTNKIDLNLIDEYGQTALIKGCSSNTEECCMLLLDHHDIKINIQDIHGNTAIHYTMEEGNYKLSYILIKKGINCELKNNEGKLCFDLLRDNQMKLILKSYSENVKNGISD